MDRLASHRAAIILRELHNIFLNRDLKSWEVWSPELLYEVWAIRVSHLADDVRGPARPGRPAADYVRVSFPANLATLRRSRFGESPGHRAAFGKSPAKQIPAACRFRTTAMHLRNFFAAIAFPGTSSARTKSRTGKSMCLLTDHAIALCLRVLGFRRQSTPNLDFSCIVSIGTKSRVGVEFDPRAIFWYVWLILIGCYSDKAFFQVVMDAILRWQSDKMTHDFPVILPFLARSRASHPFASVRKLADSFAMKVVD
jgi:hypothetical protein